MKEEDSFPTLSRKQSWWINVTSTKDDNEDRQVDDDDDDDVYSYEACIRDMSFYDNFKGDLPSILLN